MPYFEQFFFLPPELSSMKITTKRYWKKTKSDQHILQECYICLATFRTWQSLYSYMKFSQSYLTWTSTRWNGEVAFLYKHHFHFFRIAVRLVGGQIRTLNGFYRSAKTNIGKGRKRLSLNRVHFPWKYCSWVCWWAFLSGTDAGDCLDLQHRLFSSNSQNSLNYFLIHKTPNWHSRRLLGLAKLYVPCKLQMLFLNVKWAHSLQCRKLLIKVVNWFTAQKLLQKNCWKYVYS